MKEIEQSTLERLANGNTDAIAMARAAVASRNLSEEDVGRLWESAVAGMLKLNDNGSTGAKMQLIYLVVAPQGQRDDRLRSLPHPLFMLYDDLFNLAAFAHGPRAFAPAIKTGASVVRVKKNEVEARGFDTKRYLELARECLLNALERGDEETKKYAAIALRHFEYDSKVKKALLDIVNNGKPQDVKEAAEDSLAHIRVSREGATAMADKRLLLLKYPYLTPQANYLEYIYGAVETIMDSINDAEKETEVRIAVRQLVGFGTKPRPIERLFGAKSRKAIRESIENALLHALTNGNKELREDAMRGLVFIGSKRVENILIRIAGRSDYGSEVRETALTVLKAIQKKRFGNTLPPPLPRRVPKQPPRPRAQLRA